MKTDKALSAILLGGVLAFGVPLSAQAQTAAATTTSKETTPGQGVVTQTTTVTAKIVGIDRAKRTLQVQFADGRTRDLEAGPEVHNFAQLNVGDEVHAKYVEALSLELRKAGSATLTAGANEATVRKMVGDKPTARVGRLVTAVGEVVEIDRAKKTVVLRGAGGHLVDLHLDDPAQFDNVVAGDKVEAIYAEALVLEVKAAP